MTVNALRGGNMLREARKTTPVAFRVPEDGKHLLRAAAAREGVALSDWLRSAAAARLSRDLGTTVDLTPHGMAAGEYDGDDD